jgi:thioredoxin 1
MNNVVQITDQTFADTINYNNIVVIDYYANWCGPCKAYSPIFDRVAKEFIGRAVFGKINTDEFSFMSEHNIRSLPTTVVLKNRQVVEKITGIITEEDLRNNITKHVS